MRLIKSSLDALGTGAGVAWPFFGLVSSALGLAAGSAGAMLTGSVACVMFCTVFTATFFISYQQATDEMREAQNKDLETSETLKIHLMNYLSDIHRLFQSECKKQNHRPIQTKALAFIIKQMNQDIQQTQKNKFRHSDHTFELIQAILNIKGHRKFLSALIENDFDFESDESYRAILNKLVENHLENKVSKDVDLASSFKAWFIGAAGAFGAVTGFTAGFLGLLIGVGALMTLPMVSAIVWSVIGLGAGLAVLSGGHCALRSQKLHTLNQKTHHSSELSKDFESIQIERQSQIRSNYELSHTRKAANDPQHPSFGHRFFQDNDTSGHRLKDAGLSNYCSNSKGI